MAISQLRTTVRTSSAPALRIAIVASVLIAGILLLALATSAVTAPACAYCHVSQSKALLSAAGGHSRMACAGCHVPDDVGGRLGFAVDQVFVMALRVKTFPDRARAAVPDAVCSKCHHFAQGSVTGTALRIEHAACGEGRACTDCHVDTGHAAAARWPRRVDMGACLGCHVDKGASTACDACHAKRSTRDRITTGSIRLLHGKNWRTTHGMGDMRTCSSCHAAGFCGKCHGAGVPHNGTFNVDHGALSQTPSARCLGCHRRTFCDDCHGIKMPHPAGFTAGHSKLIKTSGDAGCKKCHTDSDCTDCHVMHVHPPGGAGR